MRKVAAIALVCLFTLPAASVADYLTLEEIVGLERVSSVAMSPAGDRIVALQNATNSGGYQDGCLGRFLPAMDAWQRSWGFAGADSHEPEIAHSFTPDRSDPRRSAEKPGIRSRGSAARLSAKFGCKDCSKST